jgi:hypothetical protein
MISQARNFEHAQVAPLAESGATVRVPQSLRPIHDLNRRVLTLLAQPKVDAAGSDFHRDTEVGRVLCDADPAVQDALAHCPFLLVDASFRDAVRWQSTARHSAENRTHNGSEPPANILDLARASCLLAWHLVHSDHVAAKLILGVSPECAAHISQKSLTEIQEMAVQLVQHRCFRPRWHDRPEVWRGLISLMQSSSGPATAAVSIRGLQFFLGDLVATDTQ